MFLIFFIILLILPSYSNDWEECFLSSYKNELYSQENNGAFKQKIHIGREKTTKCHKPLSPSLDVDTIIPLTSQRNHKKKSGTELHLGLLKDTKLDKVIIPHEKWPQRTCGHLRMNFNDFSSNDESKYGDGTGVLVGPCHVLTAAHNLFDAKTEKWAKDVIFCPSLQDNQAPYGKLRGAVLLVHKKWIIESRKEHKYDVQLTENAPALIKEGQLVFYRKINQFYCKIKDNIEIEIKNKEDLKCQEDSTLLHNDGISEKHFKYLENIFNKAINTEINDKDKQILFKIASSLNYTNKKREYDIGMVILDTIYPSKIEWIGNKIGWMGIISGEDQIFDGKNITLSGYPTNVQSQSELIQMMEMTQEKIHPLQFPSNRIRYWIDTYLGNSGSPVWLEWNDKEQYIVGIHTYGKIFQKKNNSQDSYDISKKSYNEAVRITEDNFNLIVKAINDFYPIEIEGADVEEHSMELLKSAHPPQHLKLPLNKNITVKTQSKINFEESFFKILSTNNSLKALDLSESQFNIYINAINIFNIIPLQILILQNLKANDARIGSLATSLITSKSNLTFLDLSGNIDITNIEPLICLVEQKRDMIRLDISNVKVSEYDKLLECLKRNFKDKLLYYLDKNLKSLPIQKFLYALQAIIPKSQNLSFFTAEIDLDNGCNFLLEIAEADNCDLTGKFDVDGWEDLLSLIIIKNTKLKKLLIGNNKIQDYQISKLAIFIKFNQSLEFLNLQDNLLNDKEIKEIVLSLQRNQKLIIVIDGNKHTQDGKKAIIRRRQFLGQINNPAGLCFSSSLAENMQEISEKEAKKALPKQTTSFPRIPNPNNKSTYETAKELYKNSLELLKTGAIEKSNKNLNQAIKLYQACVLDRNEHAAFSLANIFKQQGRFEEALVYCREAMDLGHDQAEGLLLKDITSGLEKLNIK